MGGAESVVRALSCVRLGVLAGPHDGFSGEWRGRRIPSLPVERPSHLRVRSEARRDAGVCVASGGAAGL